MARREPVVRSALWLPLFDELSDPTVCARLAAEAEEAGWHGFFVWDQLRWEAPVRQVADPWITLAAIATATERLRLGPMVTPLPRRRPVKVARETATLDLLSGGRLTLGVGIGGDRFARELSKTGEQLDDRARGEMLDEALEILTTAWSGEPVHHHGDHYTVDDIAVPPPAGAATRRPGVDRRLSRQGQADAAGRPIRRVLPGQPRAPRSARRGRRHGRRAATGFDRTVRLRRRLSPSVSIRARGSRRVPRGGFRSSNRTRCRRTRCAACFAMARWRAEHPDPERLQQRTVRVLVAAQVLGGAAIGVGAAVSPLLAKEILGGDDTFAGLAFAALTFGSALAAVPLSRLMSRRGRRPGLVRGYVTAATGAGAAVIAAEIESFPLLLAGMVLLGSGTAANLLARYAGADLAAPEHRARAISTVVWATTIGAVAGPNALGPTGRLAELARSAVPGRPVPGGIRLVRGGGRGHRAAPAARPARRRRRSRDRGSTRVATIRCSRSSASCCATAPRGPGSLPWRRPTASWWR